MRRNAVQPRSGNPDGNARPAGLPIALRPWAHAFAGMPEAHLLVIGRLMASLSPLIEAQETATTSGLDELDSFDDIAATGPLDRLMTSELMWLKLMKGEFARRVAEGEALRRRPIYRDPADDRTVAVLIDNGHRMLGRRRLVALTALLILGSAALRRGDRFLWASTCHVGPAWQEGITRRALSRYINQTGVGEMNERAVRALLRDAPENLDDDRIIPWVISPPGADLGEWSPRYRLEVDEQRLVVPEPSDGGDAVIYADVAVISQHRIRRTARFPFPDEHLCAETLRAPFQKSLRDRSVARGETWAPDWISREADDGAAILRDADGVIMFRRHFEPLRFDIQAQDALLGARWPGNGPGTIVLREDNQVHVFRFSPQGHVFSRGSTSLAADHPLLAGTHAEAAVPPLLRIGRKATVTVGAPNGQLYAITMLDDAVHSGLTITLSDPTQDLRLLARARSWLLCETERGGRQVLVLVHARNGRRIFLNHDTRLQDAGRIKGLETIGETGGALIHCNGSWHWIAPTWWPESEIPTELPVANDAFLLRVDPIQHARNAILHSQSSSYPFGQRRWRALFWSPTDGLEEWTFSSGKWSRFQRKSPNFDGRVTAMSLIGKNAFARVEDEAGSAVLLEFRPGLDTATIKQSGPRWWESATCVDY